MDVREQSLHELHEIKSMMERSSRFISLSGLSGIAAGICALGGAYAASDVLGTWEPTALSSLEVANPEILFNRLLMVAAVTFIAAFIFAFVFTWMRSQKKNLPLWGPTTTRLLWNTAIPLAAGAFFLYRAAELGQYQLLAPGCLIFYGLTLINASKYTLPELRYLGYAQLILGIISLWVPAYGLYFWAAGFGVLHIIYGIFMWYKYERNDDKPDTE